MFTEEQNAEIDRRISAAIGQFKDGLVLDISRQRSHIRQMQTISTVTVKLKHGDDVIAEGKFNTTG